MVRVWTVTTGTNERLDRVLPREFSDLSRSRIQALIASGDVTVDGEPAKGSQRLEVGQRVELVMTAPTASGLLPEALNVPVLFEDDHLVVVVKPAGMVVHPSAGHATGTLVNALLHQIKDLSGIGGEARPGIVHRLDAGTSGVMVAAKDDQTHRALCALFAAHDLDRRYLAVIHRVPLHDAGTFRSVLGRDPNNRLKIASVAEVVSEVDDMAVERWGEDDEEEAPVIVTNRGRGRLAITDWRVVERGDRVALVMCKLHTGRTHQVRVHLSEAGHPIVGDLVYSRRDRVSPAALRAYVDALSHPLLHAFRLGFRHPVDGVYRSFNAPPPADFVALCALAGLTIPDVHTTV